MKIAQIATAALVGLGLVSQAGAQVRVYGTGSTAFRSETFVAIKTLFDGGNPTIAARSGSHANGDNGAYMNFTGTIGGTNVIVKCLWNGSEDGIKATATPGALPLTYLADGATGIVSTGPAGGELDGSATAPDFAMADTSQAVSFVKTPSLGSTSANPVGIVTFKWCKITNSVAPATWLRLTNVTHPQLRNLFAGPQVAAFFTGNTNDTNFVYMMGRNNGSGTRANVLADTAYGITKPVDQWAPGATSLSTPVFPLIEVGNDGYNGGGTLAKALALDRSDLEADPVDNTITGWYAFGYLGISDAGTLPEVTLNGVPSTRANVIEGTYSYWGREFLLTKISVGQFQGDFSQNLRLAIPTTLNGTTGIKLTDMHATKSSDVAFPAHN